MFSEKRRTQILSLYKTPLLKPYASFSNNLVEKANLGSIKMVGDIYKTAASWQCFPKSAENKSSTLIKCLALNVTQVSAITWSTKLERVTNTG